MNRLKNANLLSVIICAIIIIALTSCHNSYPTQLVQADSLLIRGDYKNVDSILADYDKKPSSKKSSRMFRQLLKMGRLFVDEELTANNFATVDSLCRYYDHSSTYDEYAQALCFMGEIYRVNGDYPSALDVFLKGEKIAKECNNSYVAGWFYKEIGDIYFIQRMLDECTIYYRNYYNIAVSNRDTLRMALASYRMGRVHTIKNNVDSTISYYQKAIELGRHLAHPENIIPQAKGALGDIYTQIEEYDKAKAQMSRDSIYDYDWAFWHLGQNHTDSAIYYFEKIHPQLGLPAYEEAIRYLAQLEEKRGNISKALSYYRALPAIADSLTAQSRVEETRRIDAQYNVNMFIKERDDMALQKRISQTLLLAIVIVVVLGLIIVFYAWRFYQQKKNAEILLERRLRREKERQHRQSISRIEENKQKIALLEQQLAEAYRRNDMAVVDRIKLDTELLTTENQNLEVRQQRKELALKEFQESKLYKQIKCSSHENNFHLSETEWKQLAQYIDDVYDDFSNRLLRLCNMSEMELRVCYLIKIDVPPIAISALVCRNKNAISMLRKRLYEKITHQEGNAKQLDDFIKHF